MTAKKYSLTEEHRAQLGPWADRWIAIALRTTPQTVEDRAIMRAAMDGAYRAANLAPAIGVFARSPISAAWAWAGATAWIASRATMPETAAREGVLDEIRAQLPAAFCRVTMDESVPPFGLKDEICALTSECAATAPLGTVTGRSTKAHRAAAASAFRDALRSWSSSRDGGNHWAAWACRLSFFDRVVGLNLPIYEQWRHYEAAAIHAGPRHEAPTFWIASDFPTTIGREQQGERWIAHCATGPQIAWADGWRSYSWHGQRVPGDWIDRPERLTPEIALGQSNADLRTAAVEICGWERVLGALPHRVIQSDPDPSIGTLISVDLPDAPDTRYVRALCGTGRTVHYRASQTACTALEAAADSYGLRPEEYRPEART
jgi:hypothetical protein